jgi:hypothetical protein
VFTVAFASAATLNVNGNTIQAGVDSNLACDADGVQASWGLETTDNSVRYVKITDISDQCLNQDLFVKINDAAGDAQGPITITGSSVTVHFTTPYPQPEQINSLRVWIEG